MKLKASLTIEAAIFFPLLLTVYLTGMTMGIHLYEQIGGQKEQEAVADIWVVDDFYRYQMLKEAVK